MSRIERVAVLRGGPNDEYAQSLRIGARVLDVLNTLGYPTKDIPITRRGEWLDNGRVRSPLAALTGVDVAFVSLRGTYAEDGAVQQALAHAGIRYTGSRSLPTASAYNKRLAKDVVRRLGLRVPRHRVVEPGDANTVRAAADLIASRFGPEYCIKPLRGGGSAGFHHVRPGAPLADALIEAFATVENTESLIVEEFIRGREATIGLLSAYRSESDYAFPTIEIGTPIESPYHSTAAKAADSVPISAPGRFSLGEREQLMHVARSAHRQLGLDQYSRTDCIVRDGTVYFLEINPLPQLQERS